MGTGCPEMRATTVGTAWAWRAWATSGAASTSTRATWKRPAYCPASCSRREASSALAWLRGLWRTTMTGTWVETSATSRRLEASTSTTSGTGRPPPAPPAAPDVGVGVPPAEPAGLVAGAKLDRSTAPNMLMSSCLPRAVARLLHWSGSCGVLERRRGEQAQPLGQRPERASGPTPSDHGAGPGTGGAQDGLAVADAVGAGVLESSRSTFISAVSAPRTATLSLLPSLGMEKATMES